MSHGLDKVALARCTAVAGGQAAGVNARELDGSHMVILQFTTRTGKVMRPLGLLLKDAAFLRDQLTRAITAESAKAIRGDL